MRGEARRFDPSEHRESTPPESGKRFTHETENAGTPSMADRLKELESATAGLDERFAAKVSELSGSIDGKDTAAAKTATTELYRIQDEIDLVHAEKEYVSARLAEEKIAEELGAISQRLVDASTNNDFGAVEEIAKEIDAYQERAAEAKKEAEARDKALKESIREVKNRKYREFKAREKEEKETKERDRVAAHNKEYQDDIAKEAALDAEMAEEEASNSEVATAIADVIDLAKVRAEREGHGERQPSMKEETDAAIAEVIDLAKEKAAREGHGKKVEKPEEYDVELPDFAPTDSDKLFPDLQDSEIDALFKGITSEAAAEDDSLKENLEWIKAEGDQGRELRESLDWITKDSARKAEKEKKGGAEEEYDIDISELRSEPPTAKEIADVIEKNELSPERAEDLERDLAWYDDRITKIIGGEFMKGEKGEKIPTRLGLKDLEAALSIRGIDMDTMVSGWERTKLSFRTLFDRETKRFVEEYNVRLHEFIQAESDRARAEVEIKDPKQYIASMRKKWKRLARTRMAATSLARKNRRNAGLWMFR